MTDWVEKYEANMDGFTYCRDFIQQHPQISATAKAEVIAAITDDIIRPSVARRYRGIKQEVRCI